MILPSAFMYPLPLISGSNLKNEDIPSDKHPNKVWLVYAYDPDTSEIVAFIWGRRNLKTAKQLRAKLDELGVDFGYICCDNWDSFLTAFDFDFKKVGKYHTVDIEGNNNRFRQRLRRVFRKTSCFSKKLANHFKAFELLFHYVNYGWV